MSEQGNMLDASFGSEHAVTKRRIHSQPDIGNAVKLSRVSESPKESGGTKVAASVAADDKGAGKDVTLLAKFFHTSTTVADSLRHGFRPGHNETETFAAILDAAKGAFNGGGAGPFIDDECCDLFKMDKNASDIDVSTFKTEGEDSTQPEDYGLTTSFKFAKANAEVLGHDVTTGDEGNFSEDEQGEDEGVERDCDPDGEESHLKKVSCALLYSALAIVSNNRLRNEENQMDHGELTAHLAGVIKGMDLDSDLVAQFAEMGLEPESIDQVESMAEQIASPLLTVLNMGERDAARNSSEFRQLPEVVRDSLLDFWNGEAEAEGEILEEELEWMD